MAWGMDCGDGWFFILDALYARIQNYIDNPPYIYKKTFKFIVLVYGIGLWKLYIFQISGFIGESYLSGDRPPVPQVVAHQVKENLEDFVFIILAEMIIFVVLLEWQKQWHIEPVKNVVLPMSS